MPDNITRSRHGTLLAVPLALVSLLTTTAAGCGSGSGSGGSTHVAIQGNPVAAHKCKTVLDLHTPAAKQLTATYSVSCNFPLTSASTTLVIQGRPTGSGGTAWDNLSDPKVSEAVSSIFLTYTVPCVTSLEYQGSASIDAVGVDGTPVNTLDTTTPRSYGPSECSGS